MLRLMKLNRDYVIRNLRSHDVSLIHMHLMYVFASSVHCNSLETMTKPTAIKTRDVHTVIFLNSSLH